MKHKNSERQRRLTDIEFSKAFENRITTLMDKKDNHMDFSLDPSGKTGVLRIDGDLSQDRMKELKAALLSGMVQAAQVTVYLGAVTALDLSCLQVLRDAHRSFMLKNKILLFGGEGVAAVRQAAQRAGLIGGWIYNSGPETACLREGGAR